MLSLIQQLARVTGLHDKASIAYLKLIARPRQIAFSIEQQAGASVICLRRGRRVLKAAHRHYVYVADLIRFFDYYFDAVEPQIIEECFVVDYSEPREHVLKGSGLAFSFSSLAESCETTDIYIQKANLRKSDVVFDLGAYCGATTQAFSEVVGVDGKVYAFEPDLQNYEALTRNIKRHEMGNVVVVRKGIWSSESTLEFLSEGNMGSGVKTFLDRPGASNRVAVTSISQAVRDLKIQRLDFIKMDIEGAEVEALLGAKDALKRFAPRLVVEPHKVRGQMTTSEVCNLLHANRYRCEVIPQGQLDLPLIYAEPA